MAGNSSRHGVAALLENQIGYRHLKGFLRGQLDPLALDLMRSGRQCTAVADQRSRAKGSHPGEQQTSG